MVNSRRVTASRALTWCHLVRQLVAVCKGQVLLSSCCKGIATHFTVAYGSNIMEHSRPASTCSLAIASS